MSNTIKPLPLWRVDAGNRKESIVRDQAKKIDAAGNKDGKVSVEEVEAYDKKLDAIMGDHRFSAWADPTNDPKKKDAWVEHNYTGYVRENVEHPGHSLAADLAVRTFGGVLEGAAALLWFGPSVWIDGKKVGG